MWIFHLYISTNIILSVLIQTIAVLWDSSSNCMQHWSSANRMKIHGNPLRTIRSHSVQPGKAGKVSRRASDIINMDLWNLDSRLSQLWKYYPSWLLTCQRNPTTWFFHYQIKPEIIFRIIVSLFSSQRTLHQLRWPVLLTEVWAIWYQ